MTRIAVLGGTGYAGHHIVRAAAARGHQVTATSRKPPEQPVDGVAYVQGDVLDPAFLDQVVTDADVVVHALSPRGQLQGELEKVAAGLADRADRAGARLGVIGGAGTLHVAPGGPKLLDLPDLPEDFRPEARTMDAILTALQTGSSTLDWFYLTPGAGFGQWAPGEATGRFRIGDNVLLTDDAGNSFISGADFATALVDEIENPTHRRQRFTVAY